MKKGEICSKLFSVKQNELTHLKVKVLRRHFQSPTTNLHILAPGHTKVLFETRFWWKESEEFDQEDEMFAKKYFAKSRIGITESAENFINI